MRLQCGTRHAAHFFIQGARLLLGGVFIVAAFMKVSWLHESPETAQTTILSGWSGYWLIALELALGMWLLSGKGSGAALSTSLLILCMFSGFLIAELFQDNPESCGCFGKEAPAATARFNLALSLIRNLGLISVTALAAYLRRASG